jgi:DNA-binding NarL/FixJ family response regulator
MLKILIVDDHTMFAEGIATILAQEPDIEVIAICKDSKELFLQLETHHTDIVLLDINLGKDNGIDICKQIVNNFPLTKVLAISMYDDESFITKMFKSGALGYVLKNTGREELLKAIHTIARGEIYHGADIVNIIFQSMNHKKKQEKNLFTIRFTRREKEILDLIVKGLTTRQIADTLFVSEKTVETHRGNLLTKFSVKNVAGLVKLAIDYGYVE